MQRKTRALGALRQERADFRAVQERDVLGPEDIEPGTVLVLADWQYVGHGHTPGESLLAASIARDLRLNRDTAREALRDQLALEGASMTTATRRCRPCRKSRRGASSDALLSTP
ncbi:hypothetical protein SAMN05216252_102220 [Actinacidiphila glaucinigra]|uniref:Uncharacterized protein n=1 Tax=Actinacidiphila glaucinigra TaxID=235986 RepID=A0A239AXA3_9ACTN|nr:hypothetical protein SAMN05216252_102220 [Actinacidiphila glaucinigra]